MNELKNEFLFGEAQFGEGALVGLPVDMVYLGRSPATVFVESFFQRWASCCFTKMGRVVACNVDVSDPEGDFARGDHMDMFGRSSICLECGSGVSVGSDVEGFHSGEFVPLTDCVLVAFDVFPFEGYG